jgi:hypothetical protein
MGVGNFFDIFDEVLEGGDVRRSVFLENLNVELARVQIKIVSPRCQPLKAQKPQRPFPHQEQKFSRGCSCKSPTYLLDSRILPHGHHLARHGAVHFYIV